MAITVQYVLKNEAAVEGRIDGTGLVNNDLWGEYSEDGGETWTAFCHRTVCAPAARTKEIIQGGVNVKGLYREMLRVNWETYPQPEAEPLLTSGDLADILAYVAEYKAWAAARDAANVEAAEAAALVVGFVPSWPITFAVG